MNEKQKTIEGFPQISRQSGIRKLEIEQLNGNTLIVHEQVIANSPSVITLGDLATRAALRLPETQLTIA